jgi:hypothetical protein
MLGQFAAGSRAWFREIIDMDRPTSRSIEGIAAAKYPDANPRLHSY